MKTTDEIVRDFERKRKGVKMFFKVLAKVLAGAVILCGVVYITFTDLNNQAQIEAKKVDTVVEAAFARGYTAGLINALRGDYDTRYILSNSAATPIGNVIQDIHSGALRLVGGRHENAPIGVGSQAVYAGFSFLRLHSAIGVGSQGETIEGGQID